MIHNEVRTQERLYPRNRLCMLYSYGVNLADMGRQIRKGADTLWDYMNRLAIISANIK